MEIEEKIKLNRLFDIYKNLLSEGQREVMDEYLSFDFTISEIAENLSISRQAVLDSVTKAEKKLKNLEEKLSFSERLDKLEREIEKLKNKRG